jgi:glycosyltransferase involved in cell wall biosynthesis
MLPESPSPFAGRGSSALEILTFADFYLPGFKAGGPVQALQGLVRGLAPDVRFHVVTRDRDLSEEDPYPGVESGVWREFGGTQVCHLAPRQLNSRRLVSIARSGLYDALYLNSVFSRFSVRLLVLRRLGLLPRVPVLLAPRGELAADALAQRAAGKRRFLGLAARAGLFRDLVWQASSDHEAEDIALQFRRLRVKGRVVVTPELSGAVPQSGKDFSGVAKEEGVLRVTFLSRISRMKNLDGALRALASVRGRVDFDIHGPVDDGEYWSACQALMAALPAHVRVRYHGVATPDRVSEIFGASDLFFLPTLGENYGHAILEALAAGCPVLISDRTRWRGIEEAGAGWEVALEEPDEIVTLLDDLVTRSPATWQRYRIAAVTYARSVLDDLGAVEQNRKLFLSLAARGGAVS